MKAKRILTLMIILVFLLACQLPGATLGQLPDGTTAPPPAGTPLLTTGDTPEPPEAENPAGAVYETPTIGPASLCASVTAIEALHLREGRGETAEHIEYLTSGQTVKVLDPAGRWWKIETEAGTVGFANSRYLQERACK
jgi:hypothetical protein